MIYEVLMVYGGGLMTVLITIIFYRWLIRIPFIDRSMLISGCVVGEIWLCLLYWYILNHMDIPVWRIVLTSIAFLMIFCLPLVMILFVVKAMIEATYVMLFSSSRFMDDSDNESFHDFLLCALFISPLPYLPLLFSFLIPLWNALSAQ